MRAFATIAAAMAITSFGYAQQAPTKVAVININGAIASTKDGQKAAADLEAKFAPKRKELDAKQAEINQLKDQLQKGANTLSDSAKDELVRSIDQKQKSWNRDAEDAQAELQQEQQKIVQELGQKVMAVMSKYATDNGYTLVLDVSNPNTPVMFASNGIDITKQVIDLYDKNAPGTTTTSSAVPRPAAPARTAPATTTHKP